MGGRSWWYLTDYEKSPARALKRLRERVFADGEYDYPGGAPETLEALLDQAAEEGTNSILDIERVGKEAGVCIAGPVSPRVLLSIFGSETPARPQVEEHVPRLADSLPRWRCVYFPVFEGQQPAQWCFAGGSGDAPAMRVRRVPRDRTGFRPGAALARVMGPGPFLDPLTIAPALWGYVDAHGLRRGSQSVMVDPTLAAAIEREPGLVDIREVMGAFMAISEQALGAIPFPPEPEPPPLNDDPAAFGRWLGEQMKKAREQDQKGRP